MKILRKKAIALGLAAGTAVGAAGVAYAAWNASGSGTGAATAGNATGLSIAPDASTAALYPQGSVAVKVLLTNPNPYDVAVSGFAGTSLSVDSGHSANCSTTGVTFTPSTGLTGIVVGHGASNTLVTTAGTLNATNAIDNGCQGATFTVTNLTLSGQSN